MLSRLCRPARTVGALLVLAAGLLVACTAPATEGSSTTAATTAGSVATIAVGGATTASSASSRPSAAQYLSTYPSSSTTTVSSSAGPVTVSVAPASPPDGDTVTAVGDSIMVGAEPDLASAMPGIAIDAQVGRLVEEGLPILQNLADQGELRDSVVFELGTNGPFSDDQFDDLLRIVDGRHLVVVNNFCGHCEWIADNNAMIDRRCTPAVGCAVADWSTVATAHPEFFGPGSEGIHITTGTEGARRFVDLIVAALQ